jgi:hypothetical protein
MARTRRTALSTAAATVAVSTALAVMPATVAQATYASKYAHALAAVQLFETDGYAGIGLPARHAVWVKACYRDVCARDRLRPDPVCNTSVCLGTALRGVRVTTRLVVVATYF